MIGNSFSPRHKDVATMEFFRHESTYVDGGIVGMCFKFKLHPMSLNLFHIIHKKALNSIHM